MNGMRLDTLVVGMDFGESSLTAARWAAQHLAPAAELVLVHVIEAPPPPAFLRSVLPPYERMLELAREDAVRLMRELTRTLESRRIRTEIREGRPATEIAAVAGAARADLIVVAERGKDASSRLLLGSTAEQLARCAPVPVLIARGLPEAGPRSVLVPIADDEASLELLEWARSFRERFAAAVTIVHALNTGLYGLFRFVRSEEELRGIERRARESAVAWAEERTRAAGFEPGAAAVEIDFGDPGFEIVAAADRAAADLILVGHRNAEAEAAGEVDRVARAVLRASSLPVLVLANRACG
ncbi:MAG TPA: universal stress protein [Longimicrobiales bacterium]